MPPSQLKQLKASLRDNGVLGPQQSKKQRKTNNRDAQRKAKRNVALEGIRERFNPFEAKAPARREKFEIASNKPTKRTIERPGVTRGLGEERRRETLLKEMQSRNKVGGLLDRRFGEDDPNMTPEQKAAERFAQQALRSNKKSSMFNLEEDSEEEITLTHGGRALTLDKNAVRDDFDEDVSVSEADDFDAQDDRPRKRTRIEDDEGAESQDDENVPERKKSKHEVMQEVIAKSKAYKAARQAAKEDDDDLRLELDKGMSELFASLQGKPALPKQLPSPPTTDSEPTLDPSRAAMLAGKSREEAEKEYEANIRQLKLEARSKPSVRTKSQEEKAAEEKARLEDLERKRLRRMKGEPDTSDEESEAGDGVELDEEVDDAEAFGLEQPQPEPRYIPQLDVEDEDEFVMDDIVASDSEADIDSGAESDDESNASYELEDDGDDDFINGLVLPKSTSLKQVPAKTSLPAQSLPFTFPCPQNYDELVGATQSLDADDLPTVVQRIRALYHKGLAEGNSEKLGKFAGALVPWISGLTDRQCKPNASMQVIEQLIRHLHSMAKSQPSEVSASFREHFRGLLRQEGVSLSPGDLIVLTSVSTIYPTSDQWHSVVTPAMTLLARYIAQSPIESQLDLLKGTYACSLLLRYQVRSERYAPEAINFICKAIQQLAPVKKGLSLPPLTAPEILETTDFHIKSPSKEAPSARLNFEHIRTLSQGKKAPQTSSESLLLTYLNLVKPIITLYSTKSAFPELISPIHSLLTTHLSENSTLTHLHPATQTTVTNLLKTLNTAISTSLDDRRPLLLHNHRPLAIKSSYPAFVDNYNPLRHQQDPDRERAEMNKLKAEHKKERKGAMRELRKDANFMAREQLREKKVRDEAYEKKFKRLVAEIQGEEGREAKEYEKVKAKRQGRF